ncbi:P-loop NTPase fold protein (plasmid) [Psychrobium sp. nBUS_13]|uniref:P-loop NTPase fold protein n=1 Tax=Psychrobium sp. nBUS_13 TaxID=3395319 RepID=UPI003EBF5B00
MSDINLNVKELIKYYCVMQVPPEYALLVKGPWGCGKSHLVKDSIEQLKESDTELKFLYVSLYGVNNIGDIEDKFFEQLNPILASKPLVFAGRIAKGVLKGALKLDLDGDGKADATANLSVPDINLADYLTDTKNCILVFDDLERCALNLQVILGYINYFVEKDGYKVVLIADEDKLLTHQDEGENTHNCYTNIKEKLIGKTVQVEADINAVFDSLVNEIFIGDVIVHNIIAKEAVKRNKAVIIKIFNQSEHENLRSLRKVILDLAQWFNIFDEMLINNERLVTQFLSLFMALSMEIHAGVLKPKKLNKLLNFNYVLDGYADNDNSDIPNKFELINDKYDLDFNDILFSESYWVQFFDKGYIDSDNIVNSLKNTQYFMEESTPDWKLLWYFINLEDDEFERLQESVQLSLNNREINDLGAIKHIAGIFLYHSSIELSQKTASDVVTEISDYLGDIFSSKCANVYEKIFQELNGFGGYSGLAYQGREIAEFVQISDLINSHIDSALNEQLATSSADVLLAMKDNPEEVIPLFDGDDREVSIYFNKPILQHIAVDEFLDAFLKMPNPIKRELGHVLTKRYDDLDKHRELVKECEWFEQLTKAIGAKLTPMAGGVSVYILKNTYEKLNEILSKRAQVTEIA